MNPARGQGSRLIDRVSGSSQPGASPVVPNLPPRGGGGERGAPQLPNNSRQHGEHRVFRLLTKAEERAYFYRVETTDPSRKRKARHNVQPSIYPSSLLHAVLHTQKIHG